MGRWGCILRLQLIYNKLEINGTGRIDIEFNGRPGHGNLFKFQEPGRYRKGVQFYVEPWSVENSIMLGRLYTEVLQNDIVQEVDPGRANGNGRS